MENAPSNPLPKNQPWNLLRWLTLLAFLVLAYAYVWAIQPGYGPDEPRHFAYVKRLVEKQQLPLARNGHEEDGAHALHPPLYYLLMSPVYLATRGMGEKEAMRAMKAVSPLLLLGALLLFIPTLRRIFPDRPFAAAAALAVVALLPEFLLEAAVINNDVLAILLGSLLFWFLARTWDDGPCTGRAVAAGLIMAALVNTKAIGWTLAPLWALAIGVRSQRAEGTPGRWVRDLLVGYGVLLLLGVWWHLRNYHLYGQAFMLSLPNDPLAAQFQPRHPQTGEVLSPLEVYTTGTVVTLTGRAVEGLFQSFWSQIDWIREEYRPAVWGVLLVMVLAAAVGGVLRLRDWWRETRRSVPEGEKPARTVIRSFSPIVALAAGFGLAYLNTWYLATFIHLGVYQGGRYLMPTVFGAGALLGAGWERIKPAKWHVAAAIALLALFIGLNVLCLVELVTVLNPKYVR